jgi:PAS domain S-box-containing protein
MIQAVHNQALEQRIGGGYLLQISVVFIAYLVAGKLGQATANIRSSNLGPVWPAYGIALAAILICGYRVWIGVAAGAFLVAFLSPVSHVAALGQAAGATLAATTGAFLLHRTANFHSSLSRLSDVLSLIALGGFGSAIVSASIGVSVLYATHVHAYSGLGAAWLIYWLGDATGVLLVTPLALRFTDFLKLRDRDRIAELAILLLLLALTCLVAFSDLPFIPVKLHVMAFSVLPFIMWAAIRFGVGVTALSILIVAAIATIETALGSGPFASNSTFVNAVLLDVFFGVLSVSGLSFAAVIAERENAEREREQVVSKQAAMEERLRADEAIRESEDKLRLLLDSTAEAIYGIDVEGRCTFCNPACVRALGYESVDELLGKNMHYLIHHTRADGTSIPVDECRIFRAFRVGEGAHIDDEVLWRKNGTSFPAEYWSYPQRRREELVGAVVAFLDITDRKLAEAALANVSRKLIEAQEQERTRIGRDLHDDIGQRLALLVVQLQQLHQDPLVLPEVRSRVGELQKQTSEIATDIQSLSHELHSARLQYLGIAGAIRGFCREFSEQQKVEVDFQTHDLTSPVPPETALCLFRVLQEALHNSAKHSGVRHFEVRLWGTSDGIHLTVSDSGSGFEVGVTKEALGLGLISMEERLKALNGTFSIESQPKRGTTIHARVPFRSDSRPMRAAG